MFSFNGLLILALRSEVKCKGVDRQFAAQNLDYHAFLKCLTSSEIKRANFHTIRARDFVVQTLEIEKTALNCLDLKRYWHCYRHSSPFNSRVIEEARGGECPFCIDEEKKERERSLK